MNRFEENIGYMFRDPDLLNQALTHSSYANEHKTKSNERLEFLGDSVLSIIVTDMLYRKLPNINEGGLTKTRASIVCETSLAAMSEKVKLGELLFLGRGEDVSGGRKRTSILSDAFEAVLGAIYLDGGLEACKRWFFALAKETIDTAMVEKDLKDYKTHLQEYVQSEKLGFIRYTLVEKSGPVHDSHFVMQAQIRDRFMGVGEGSSKKEAEQMAARITLEILKNEAL